MAQQTYEVPLTPEAQTFSIQLGLKTYQIYLWWNDADEGGWTIDIADSQSNPIISGIPLVTGVDLLAQYGYLDFGGTLVVLTDDSPDAVPTFTNLGNQSHLYFTTNA